MSRWGRWRRSSLARSSQGSPSFAPGFETQQTPVETGTVWALNSDGVRYARVNAELGELDTVKIANNPSAIVQGTDAVLVFTDGFSRVTTIDAANPIDVDEETPTSEETPAGPPLSRRRETSSPT